MNKIKILLSLLVGIAAAVLTLIYLFHFYVMDVCFDMGGTYSKSDNLCTLIPGGQDSYYISLSNTSMAIGIITGVIITFIISIGFNKLINKLSDNAPNTTT